MDTQYRREDGHNKYLRNDVKLLPDNTTSQKSLERR